MGDKWFTDQRRKKSGDKGQGLYGCIRGTKIHAFSIIKHHTSIGGIRLRSCKILEERYARMKRILLKF